MAWYRDKFLTFNSKQVIKTLKRALQPVISDVSIAWDLAQGWTVHQIPSSPPPLFSGDRLVVYGLLKPSEYASRDGKMEVRLHGTLGKDEEMEFLITFPIPSTASASDTDVETKSGASIHCLAAKTFIKEKQDDISGTWEIDDNKKSSIISISKSANVGSKFTSFVAVDAENHQPVPGSLRKKVVPSFGGHMMGSTMALQQASSFQSFITGGGLGYFGSLNSAFSSSSNSPFGSAPSTGMPCYGGGPPVPPPHPPGGVFQGKKAALSPQSDIAGGCSKPKGGLEFGTGAYQSVFSSNSKSLFAPLGAAACYGGGFPNPPPATGVTFQGKNETSSVLALISLQKASGAWDLTNQLVALCGKTRDALITACPMEVAVDTAEGKLLWATALALVLLMGTFLDQKDEWEMIAEKGKKWMKKSLPGGMKYDNMLESAATAVGVQI